jgi:hypothetical protein
MIYEKFQEVTDDRIVASLIGMPKAKFTALAKTFESAHHALEQGARQKRRDKTDQAGRTPRKPRLI